MIFTVNTTDNYQSNPLPPPIKIVDCFTFYNELDLLKYRLNILNDTVDYFILVESDTTFAGNPKENYYDNIKDTDDFIKFKNKIIHIIVEDFPHKYPNINVQNNEQWTNEKYQRNCISRGLSQINLLPDDVIIISDLDEIPDPTTLQKIKRREMTITMGSLQMDFYYYNLNTKLNEIWFKSKIISYETYQKINWTCDQIRMTDSVIIPNGGWHLSYFGDSKYIQNKIQQFAHQEYNSDLYTNINDINNKLKNGLDLYGRNINFSKIPIKNNAYLPPEYNKYLFNFFTPDIESFYLDYKTEKTELCEIGKKYDTDKSSQRMNVNDVRHCHPYTIFYHNLFNSKRHYNLDIAELGVLHGSSILMWQEYFYNSNIYGFEYLDELIEKFNVSFGYLPRINIFKIDVKNEKSITETLTNTDKKYDIIIDDTTHEFNDQIKIIENARHFLKPGGILIIEDIFKAFNENVYYNRLYPILNEFQKYYFVTLDHVNRVSTGWDNDKLLILHKKTVPMKK